MNKFKLFGAVLAVAVMATPAFASVQNVKISGSIDSTYIYREHFDFDDTTQEQSVFITQTILQVDADLTDNVAATVALINERAWDQDPASNATDIDLLRAFVTLREMLYSPLTVVIGRQAFAFGNSFIFDTAGTNNSAPTDSALSGIAEDLTLQTNLDAIRFILDYNPLTIVGFYGAVSPKSSGALADTDNSVNVWGLNATYELGDDMNSLVEAYIFDKKDKSDASDSIVGQVNHIKVVGGRFSTNPLEGINIQGEIAHQGGSIVHAGGGDADVRQQRDAWAYQGIVNYQVPALQDYNPVLSFEYTKLYGNNNNTTNPEEDYTGWDAFFENQDGGTIYNALFNFTDLVLYSVGLSFTPMEDVNAKFTATKVYQHEPQSGSSTVSLVQPDGDTSTSTPSTAGGRELGTEIDGVVTYDYTEDVRFGLNVGVFKPTGVINSDVSAKQILANVRVAF